MTSRNFLKTKLCCQRYKKKNTPYLVHKTLTFWGLEEVIGRHQKHLCHISIPLKSELVIVAIICS